MLILAQVGAWTITHWLIVIIVVAACIGVMMVALKQFGVQIPPWAVTIFWIVVVAFVAIVAVKLLMGML